MKSINRPSVSKGTNSVKELARGDVRVNFDLDTELHTKLKIYAAQRGVSIKELFTEYVRELTRS